MFNGFGEKFSFFLRVITFKCIWRFFDLKQGGGVYRVVIRLSDFGPKRGAVFIREVGIIWYERDGNYSFSVFFYLFWQLEELHPPPLKNKQLPPSPPNSSNCGWICGQKTSPSCLSLGGGRCVSHSNPFVPTDLVAQMLQCTQCTPSCQGSIWLRSYSAFSALSTPPPLPRQTLWSDPRNHAVHSVHPLSPTTHNSSHYRLHPIVPHGIFQVKKMKPFLKKKTLLFCQIITSLSIVFCCFSPLETVLKAFLEKVKKNMFFPKFWIKIN